MANPHATVAWTLGATFGLLTGKAPYDAYGIVDIFSCIMADS